VCVIGRENDEEWVEEIFFGESGEHEWGKWGEWGT